MNNNNNKRGDRYPPSVIPDLIKILDEIKLPLLRFIRYYHILSYYDVTNNFNN